MSAPSGARLVAASPEELQRRSLDVVPEAPVRLLVGGGHPLDPGVEVVEPPAALLALLLGALDVLAEARGGHEQGALARVSRPFEAIGGAPQAGVRASHGGSQQAREGLAAWCLAVATQA